MSNFRVESPGSNHSTTSTDNDSNAMVSPVPRRPLFKDASADSSQKMVTLISPASGGSLAFSDHRRLGSHEPMSDTALRKLNARTFSSPDITNPMAISNASKEKTTRSAGSSGLGVDLRSLMRRHKSKSRSLPDSLGDLPSDGSSDPSTGAATDATSKKKIRTSSLDAGEAAARRSVIEQQQPTPVAVTSPRIFSDSTLKKHKRKISRSREEVASMARRGRITPDPRSIQGLRMRANSRQRAMSPPSRRSSSKSISNSALLEPEPILSQKSIKNRYVVFVH